MKVLIAFAAVLLLPVSGAFAQAPASPAPPAVPQKPVAKAPPQAQVLDSVIAIINGNVLLQSDVDQEMRFAALLPPGPNTPEAAAERLISRTLILQEMKEQQQPVVVGREDAEKNLDELRKVLPACGHGLCATEAGWQRFLAEHDLKADQVASLWEQRLAILNYIDLRFRAGIRISREQVNAYYQKTLVPEFEKRHEKAPPAATLAPRIREILLQQEVNVSLQDWLKSLRDQGSVQILNPAYGQSSSDTGSDAGNGGEGGL